MIADLIAQDSLGQDLLIVQIKGRVLESDIVPEVLAYVEQASRSIPFGMLVDPENIYILEQNRNSPTENSIKLRTGDILRLYDPEFENRRVFADYLRALIEDWLDDLARHWKSSTPPGADELASIGLLQRLERATTRREVPVGGNSLY